MDPLDTYKKLNADLIMQVQEYRQKQALFERKSMQMMQESLLQQRVIREQKMIIESFVNQNSQDLNQFLGHLVDGHKQNMTVVTEFVQNMMLKLQGLLMHISQDSGTQPPKPKYNRPVAAAPKPMSPLAAETALTTSVTHRAVRAHRSLSPVATRSKEGDEDQDQEMIELRAVDNFVTKRRRPHSPDFENNSSTQKTVTPTPPPCDPVTLPDGMLSTIPETETSVDAINNSAAIGGVIEEEKEDDEESEAEEEEKNEEIEKEGNATESEEEESETEEDIPLPSPKITQRTRRKAPTIQAPPPEEDAENIPVDEVSVVIASSTPNPRKRMLSSRSVLSPVDMNREETRAKRTRTPVPRKLAEEPLEESHSLRPRRRAAPGSLAEPSCKNKLRQ